MLGKKEPWDILEVFNLLDRVALSGRNWMGIRCSNNVRYICSDVELIG